jgi:N-acetyl-1-D-myo-inositol-2-amino-2-deoxy-alpha-D-glucopyranoside deacetylase
VVVVTAHPDDEVLIAGGLLAACAAAGTPTAVVCFTRGELGEFADASLLGGRTLAEVRRAELHAACRALGVQSLRCFARRDGELSWAPRGELTAQLARVLARLRPAAVVSFGEDGIYYHPDHIAVAQITLRAVAVVRREGLRPRLYQAVWPIQTTIELIDELRRCCLPTGLWGLETGDFGIDEPLGTFSVDLHEFTRLKLRALRCHRTQLPDGHALRRVPDDVARRHLGVERFRTVGGGASGAATLRRLAAGAAGG